MLIKEIQGKKPIVGENTYVAENATIVGEVVMGKACSVWYNAVIRGDVNSIRIGDNVNIQDGAIIHATFDKYAVSIGNNVSIGHRAIVHGCTIEDNVLIGMGSIVMDDCVVERNSIIAAGAVVTEHTRVTSGSIYAGVPARKVKELSAQQIEQITQLAQHYVTYADWAEKAPECLL